MLIVDNMSSGRRAIDFVAFAEEIFDRIVIMVSSDIFAAYLRDERRLAAFTVFAIEPLTRVQQEELIRRHATLSHGARHLPDGLIDRIENQVNSVIVSDRILPRYPFFVLSILQTFEAYMPESFTVTSYGHCYTALIVASLIKAGIRNRDQDLNPCFNFAERLAFRIWEQRRAGEDWRNTFRFDKFVEEYRTEFVIPDASVNRMRHDKYGILTSEGEFKIDYVYYFFLGMFLAKHRDKHDKIIEAMCQATYIPENYLTLIFVIHHADSTEIIDSILLKTLVTLDRTAAARLGREETQIFDELLRKVPKRVVGREQVDEERRRERGEQDATGEVVRADEEEEEDEGWVREFGNACYVILKNNELMGQILRNQYGMLRRERLREIVGIIGDAGLRLVKPILISEEELTELTVFVEEKYAEEDVEGITRLVRLLVFVWTVLNLERIVEAINVPEIKEVVDELVEGRESPAYDLIGYFYLLDSGEELTGEVASRLRTLLERHRGSGFVRWVLSIRTQQYLNTHRSEHDLEHRVMALLDIPREMRERRLGREGRRLPRPKGRKKGKKRGKRT